MKHLSHTSVSSFVLRQSMLSSWWGFAHSVRARCTPHAGLIPRAQSLFLPQASYFFDWYFIFIFIYSTLMRRGIASSAVLRSSLLYVSIGTYAFFIESIFCLPYCGKKPANSFVRRPYPRSLVNRPQAHPRPSTSTGDLFRTCVSCTRAADLILVLLCQDV